MRAEINGAHLARILRTMTEPARRHRCYLCKEIFECHVCGIADAESHPMHNKGRIRAEDIICEDCIIKHSLFVRVTGSFYLLKGRRIYSRPGTFGTSHVFYDHLTGRLLGRGTIRQQVQTKRKKETHG